MFGDTTYEKVWLVTIPALTAFGTAVLVAIVNQFQKGTSDRLTRRTERLKEQLEHLYAPLAFLVGHNHLLTGLLEAKTTPAHEEASRALLKTNTMAMLDLIKTQYAYIDRRDVDAFLRFLSDCELRGYVESHDPKLPNAEALVPWLRNQFVTAVGVRFEELNRELTGLTYGWWARLKRRKPLKVMKEDALLSKPVKST